MLIRRAVLAALFLFALVPSAFAQAQSTTELLAKPIALPELALGFAVFSIFAFLFFAVVALVAQRARHRGLIRAE